MTSSTSISPPSVLVLGGTAWLGRQVAREAAAAGARVVCLARGKSGAPADGVELVVADRDRPDALDAVTGRRWDLVVDVSRQPGQVRRAARALAPTTGHVVFVSSCSVYADHGTPGADESAELLPALDGDVMESMETYGPAKVACEQAVTDAFGPDRSLLARAGLIGGPGDPSDRTGYWPLRFARPGTPDGAVLVPDSPELPTQVVDVRDLARWVVAAGLDGVSGTMNAVGESMPLPEHLDVARRVAGHTGEVVPASPEWLAENGVASWAGECSLPLWLPLPEYAGFCARDGGAARDAGLAVRPLADTLADTLEWELAREPVASRRAGMTDADHLRLLTALRGQG